ncbi:hypothetical protein ACLB2K_059668 [Fragaria x ananassa]
MAFPGVSFSSCSNNFKSNSVVGSQTFSIDEVTRLFVALDLASSLGFQNPSQASSTTQTLSIDEVIRSFAAFIALADLKVVNLSDYGFASPKMKRICSQNRKGQKKKVQEEEKPPTINPPPAAPSNPSLKGKKVL